MTDRPDDVPAAVREAFSDRRIAAAWTMLSSSQPGDRSNAMDAVARLLEKRGLTLVDVATAVLALPAPLSAPKSAGSDDGFRPAPFASGPAGVARREASPMERAFGGFDGIFAEMTRRHEEETRRWKSSRPNPILQGEDIPQHVAGRVQILDERPTHNGIMLVVTIVGEDATWSPINAFDAATIVALKRAAEDGSAVRARLKRPRDERYAPSVAALY